MRAASGGGASGTIVVDIAGVQRASARVADAAQAYDALAGRIRNRPLPSMPPDVAARVAVELGDIARILATEPTPLIATAKELRVRAFWAEIADKLEGGYDLTGAQLTEFKVAYASGLLVRYAEPGLAAIATEYAKKVHHDEHPGGLSGFFHDAGEFFSGAWDSIKDPAVMLYHLSPLNSNFGQQWIQLGHGLAYGVSHPTEFAKALVNLDALHKRGVAYWLGNLAPTVLATVASGGAGAAVRGVTGMTALERAGLTTEAVAGLSEREAVVVLMRGQKPVEGMISADGAAVPGVLLANRRPVLGLFARERRNFAKDPLVTGPVQPSRVVFNVHDKTADLLGDTPGRTLKYVGNPTELLGMPNADEFTARYALPPEWGARDELTILHVPDGQPGWSLSGPAAPQTEWGPQFVGGAEQHLLHTVSTSNAMWSGPLPWEKVPDVGYAAQGVARVAAAGGGTALLTHPAAGGLP